MLQVFITHWDRAVTATAMPIFFMIEKTAGKATMPSPRSRSTASPVRMGI